VGDDDVSLGGTAVVNGGPRLGLHGGVHVNLAAGNDELNLDQVDARGSILVRGGAGDDAINATATTSAALAVFGDGGIDTLTLAELDVRHVGIHTGDGNDVVDIRDSAFASLGVALGDGDDSLTTAALEARLALMLGGGGEDTFNLVSENSFAHELIRGFEIPPEINLNDLPLRPRPIPRLLSRLG
jgi:hypothetical protein